jgi:hypothetical protein
LWSAVCHGNCCHDNISKNKFARKQHFFFFYKFRSRRPNSFATYWLSIKGGSFCARPWYFCKALLGVTTLQHKTDDVPTVANRVPCFVMDYIRFHGGRRGLSTNMPTAILPQHFCCCKSPSCNEACFERILPTTIHNSKQSYSQHVPGRSDRTSLFISLVYPHIHFLI